MNLGVRSPSAIVSRHAACGVTFADPSYKIHRRCRNSAKREARFAAVAPGWHHERQVRVAIESRAALGMGEHMVGVDDRCSSTDAGGSHFRDNSAVGRNLYRSCNARVRMVSDYTGMEDSGTWPLLIQWLGVALLIGAVFLVTETSRLLA